jgi:UDP:flavonoid glycosyltransferase YjiC (YdhE family)
MLGLVALGAERITFPKEVVDVVPDQVVIHHGGLSEVRSAISADLPCVSH